MVVRDSKTVDKMHSIDLEKAFKGSSISYHVFEPKKKPPRFACDLLIVAGGDGTLFYGIMGLSSPAPQILHVNLGRKGFLAEVELKDLMKRIKDLLAGKFLLERINKISAFVEGEFIGEAVNEVAFVAKSFRGVVDLNVDVSDFGSINMLGSGVLVATPLGSTAFSMSAGGPALDNTLNAFIITPILAKRPWIPIVVADSRVIRMKKIGGKEKTSLILDGLIEKELTEGVEVTIKKSKKFIDLIRFEKSYLIRRVRRALTE